MQFKQKSLAFRKEFLSQLPDESLKKVLLKTVLLFVFGAIFAFFAVGIGEIILQDRLHLPRENSFPILILLQNFPFLLVTLVLFYKSKLQKIAEEIKNSHKTTKFRLLLIVGNIVIIILTISAAYVVSYISNKTQFIAVLKQYVSLGVDSISVEYILGMSLNIITLAFMAFSEEFIFRHTLYRFFRKYGLLLALLISSFLFYMVHGQAYHIGLPYGIALCLYYEYTNDFKGTVITHTISNFTIPLASFYLAHLFLRVLV